MKLIKSLNTATSVPTIKEDVAVGGGDVAACSMPLFTSLLRRTSIKKPKVIKYGSKKVKKPSSRLKNIKEIFNAISESNEQSTSDVIAKLKDIGNKADVDYRDITSFGLTDSDGNIIKISIPSDQAAKFEQDLQHLISNNTKESAPEITEIIFKLKDHYNIVDVQWPTQEEDQEEEVQLPTDKETTDAAPDQQPTDNKIELPAPTTDSSDDESVKSLLSQVIQMLTADAEARKSEALARKSEADIKQSNLSKEQALSRIKSEEQLLDMEEYEKAQKQAQKEAKRLAQLAKWKHSIERGETDPTADTPQYNVFPEYEHTRRTPKPQEEEEVTPTITGKVRPVDIAKFIANRIK